MRRHQKTCPMCESGIRLVNYKDGRTLGRFITDRGKLLPRRITGMCARHQRQVGRGVKRARYLAILPFIKAYEA